ncbi:hypothetical protein VFPPC_15893 [Pochonia chlamydosporia 170]|uniref:Uncharacterized protein n=1 Tax=Pochonia chlamydosporia 170 TaxID=1380566 RepID=A0A179FTG9_METCM|nr:hypothetical protein VFPPC_15893 [Pochonia chlamydosporia 170]OAQ68902.1 hypothetical protein VFPPC_15893 [Pochonia chlamydosporia 170]
MKTALRENEHRRATSPFGGQKVWYNKGMACADIALRGVGPFVATVRPETFDVFTLLVGGPF